MDLNWQISSLESRESGNGGDRARCRGKHKFIVLICLSVLVTALVPLGVTPSFADEIAPSAEISWEDAPTIDGTSAIIMDAGSGDILYEKNAYERRDPASITKILTCLVVLETMELEQEVTIPYDGDGVGNNIALKKGEVLTVEQLLYAMTVYSANDAAEMLAVTAGGTMENFCDMMNERAERCGAESTTFTNANGMNYYGQENHKTTAYDLAMISREAMKNKTFRKLVSTVEYTIPATNLSKARKLKSTNKCLYEEKKTLEVDGKKRPYLYEGTLGIKTGSTGASGECFCGWAKKGGTNLIAISLNASSEDERFADVIKLWDYGFSKYYTYTAAKASEPVDEVRVRRGNKSRIALGVREDVDLTLNQGYDSENITTRIALNDEKLTAPVEKGAALGTLVVYKEDRVVAEAELYAMESAEEGLIFSYIGIADEHLPFVAGALLVALLVFIWFRRFHIQHSRRRRMRRRARRHRKMRRKEWEKERRPF